MAGFLAYFHLLRHLGPVPLALVFVLFPALAQVQAVAGGERPMDTASLLLLAAVLGAAITATTGGAQTPRRWLRRQLSGLTLRSKTSAPSSIL